MIQRQPTGSKPDHDIVNHPATQYGVPFNWKKTLLWASFLAAELAVFGYQAGLYVAAVVAVSVASIALMRRILGLRAAYLTAIAIAAVGFFCFSCTVGGSIYLYELLLELSVCLAFGVVLGGPVALGVTCLLQFTVDFLAATPQSVTPTSEKVVGPPQ
jgi:hypothetical protein